MQHKDRMIKSVFIVTALSIIGKMTGFFRETVIAAYYGAGAASDAYFVAHSLPAILFSVIGASMGVIFVPMYTQRLKEDPKGSNRFASNIISMILLLSLISSILGIILSKYIIMLIAPRLLEQNLDMATDLARIMFPMFVFISLSYLVTGVLQSHESFVVPAIISIPSNMMIVLGTVLLSKRYGIYALGWATLIGAGTQLVVQLPAVRKKMKYRFSINLKDPYNLAYWKLIIPVILGTAVDKVNIMVDNMLASSLVAGSISAINYSTKLIDFADSIAIGAIIVVVYPKLAKMNAEKDYKSLSHTAYNAIIGISQIIIPIIAATIILNKDIVRLVFQRGAFQTSHTNLTAYALSYYALGMWGIGIRGILSRVFYSLEETSTPMKVSIGVLASNITLNILLVKHMGIGGLGLATSISSTIGVLVLLYLVRKKIGSFNLKGMLKEGIKIVIVVFFMVQGMLIFRNYIPIYNYYIKFGISVGIGLAIYGGLSWILNIGLMQKFKLMKEYSNITNVQRTKYGKDAPVSVIIPCYMCKDTIERAVYSVWGQTWRPKEIILVEDCSQDGDATRNMLHSIASRYPSFWIKTVFLNTNGGPGNARNIGWELATQKYIAFLDADDAWHPQKIEVQLKTMLKNPQISISGHIYEEIRGKSNDTCIMFTEEYFKKIEIIRIKNYKMLRSNQLATSSVMLKGREIDQRFHNRKYYSEDYLLWLNAMLLGHKAIKINMPLYYIYEESGKSGLSKRLWKMQRGEIETYKILWQNGFISVIVFVLLSVLSYIKYIRRLATEGAMYAIKILNKRE